jgi:hypothetical protein
LKRHAILKFAHLPSKSIVGKISEAHMCKKYFNAQKDANCKYTPSDKLTIEELVGKLTTGASQITEKWRT